MSAQDPSKHRIAVVDDAPVLRRILVKLLDKDHQVTEFDTGAGFLSSALSFDLVLLDIDMPDMNGYDVCRQLRKRETGAALPVIFVSGHDTAPERVMAYQAGGTDFIVKPIAADEVRHKVDFVLQQQSALNSLADDTQAAREVARTAMNTLAELDTLTRGLRRCAGGADAIAIARALLDSLTDMGLAGAVQVRTRAGRLNLSSPGQGSPLQESVMDSLCSMGRLFVFGSRGIVNCEHVSVLAVNLPGDDDGRLGRLRDYLDLLAEMAESRLSTVEAAQTIAALTGALAGAGAALGQASQRTSSTRVLAQGKTVDSLRSLAGLVQSYDITDIQRETVRHTIDDTLEELASLYDDAAHTDAELVQTIAQLAGLTAAPTGHSPSVTTRSETSKPAGAR